MVHGWRSRLHYWSRHGRVLKKTAILIVLASFVVSWIIIRLTPPQRHDSVVDPVEQALRKTWQDLNSGPAPAPRELAGWLRRLTRQTDHLGQVLEAEPATWEVYQKTGRIASYEVKSLIARHAPEPAAAAMLEDYLAATLAAREASGIAAAARLKQLAEREQPPPMANDLLGDLLSRSEDAVAALNAILREASLFPDATQARKDAARLALLLEDDGCLRQIAARPDWLAQLPPHLVRSMGIQLLDPLLLWRGQALHYLELRPVAQVLTAALVGALWFVILVLYTPAERGRWWRPVPPLVAGIASVWLVYPFIMWQEALLGMDAQAPFPYDLWYVIAGVGLREEVAKLLLASLFMPWLLRARVPGRALMVGAFVGLGFALEENVGYYLKHGGAVAVVRFFTANFLHAALTGIATHALYTLLRARFHHAGQFLMAFAGVVVVHGVYDYDFPGDQGDLSNIVPIVLLAFTAWRFLDLLDSELPPVRSGRSLSPAAVFMLGSALLMAWTFLSTAVETPDTLSLNLAAKSCVGALPLMLIYWRRLESNSGVF